MRRQQSKVVVITGASSGIGRGAALALTRAGHRLVLAARDQAALEEVAQACRTLGAEVAVIPTDVSRTRPVQALANAAIARFGAVDVWINDAGVGSVGAFDETPIGVTRQIIRTNLLGYMYGAHAIVPHFKARGRGTLINLLSLGSWVPMPYAAPYSAAKFGLRGFTEALRGELSGWPHIHVCDVHPSFVDTPGMQHGANYASVELKPPPGVLPVDAVVRAIVRLLDHPQRQVVVGRGVTAMARSARTLAPSLTGWTSARLLRGYFRFGERAATGPGNVFEPLSPARVSGSWIRRGARVTATALAGGAILATAGLLARRGNLYR